MVEGKETFMTGGSWIRLTMQGKSLHGRVCIQWKDRQVRRSDFVLVRFPSPWSAHQAQMIQQQCGIGRPHAGYDITNFVMDLPMRVSHSSDNLLVHTSDLTGYTPRISPIVEHRLTKGTVAALGGKVMHFIEHYYAGRAVGTTVLEPTSPTFELFGLTFRSAQEAHEALTHWTSSESLSVDGNRVYPQVRTHNKTCVETQLLKLCNDIATIRAEPRIAVPKIHVPAPPLVKIIVPPCP